jgi:uncharacterized membrane protein
VNDERADDVAASDDVAAAGDGTALRQADESHLVVEGTQTGEDAEPAAEADVREADDSQSVVELTPTGGRRREWVGDARDYSRSVGEFLRDNSGPIALTLTLAGIVIWALIFSSLGIRHHRNFATWAYDMAIYDQAFWLVSRGGQTFLTVRGLDVWGHHLNLVAYIFAPFYRWFGAGPEFLYAVQNVTLALGALPVYLIAKRRFGGPTRWFAPYVGLAFAAAYLLYAPAQFVAWINFHPEALVITPFLLAWYFAMVRRWGWFFAFVVIAMAMREDTALAVIMLGVVLLIVNRHSESRGKDARMALATVALGFVWYVVATQVIIRHFNAGEPPFYLSFFFQQYGGSFSGIVRNSLRHPNWVVRDAVQPDRIRFYRDLMLPLGGLPLASPLHLLMAAPQLLASVIGGSPYARQILYQYTSVMIAPILIASIEGARNIWVRFRWLRKWILPWLLVCAYVTNVAWSPSPFGDRYGVWARSNPRAETMQEAVELVPEDAAVTSTFNLGPHLSRREQSYDWPNPFWPAYWGNEAPGVPDCTRFPSASEVDYLVIDRSLFAGDPNQMAFIDGLVTSGQFEVVMDERLADGGPGVLVARRVEPGPDGEELPVNCPGGLFEAMQLSGIEPPPQPTESPGATLPPVTTPPAQGGVGEDISTTSSTSPR